MGSTLSLCPFLVKTLFCLWVHRWHFHQTFLKSGCSTGIMWVLVHFLLEWAVSTETVTSHSSDSFWNQAVPLELCHSAFGLTHLEEVCSTGTALFSPLVQFLFCTAPTGTMLFSLWSPFLKLDSSYWNYVGIWPTNCLDFCCRKRKKKPLEKWDPSYLNTLRAPLLWGPPSWFYVSNMSLIIYISN